MRRDKNGGYLFLWCLLVLSLSINSCILVKKDNTKNLNIEESFGIKIMGLRLSADGYMLDLRFRVMDPERSKPFFDHTVKPYLVDKRTGGRFSILDAPKIGSLRQMPKTPEINKVYFILFANPGKFLKKGDILSLVVGNIRIDNIIIE